MKVKELVDIMDGDFTIVSKGGIKCESGSTIPDAILKAKVQSIKLDVDGMMINIEEPIKSETLEDLGYSFEVGV